MAPFYTENSAATALSARLTTRYVAMLFLKYSSFSNTTSSTNNFVSPNVYVLDLLCRSLTDQNKTCKRQIISYQSTVHAVFLVLFRKITGD